MPGVKLSSEASKSLRTWSETANKARRDRVAQVLEAIGDGTWDTRWRTIPYEPDAPIAEIRPGRNLVVRVGALLDEENPGTVWIAYLKVWTVEDDEIDLPNREPPDP